MIKGLEEQGDMPSKAIFLLMYVAKPMKRVAKPLMCVAAMFLLMCVAKLRVE